MIILAKEMSRLLKNGNFWSNDRINLGQTAEFYWITVVNIPFNPKI